MELQQKLPQESAKSGSPRLRATVTTMGSNRPGGGHPLDSYSTMGCSCSKQTTGRVQELNANQL